MLATKAQNLNQKASPYAHQRPSIYAYANSQNHSRIVMVFTKHYNPYPYILTGNTLFDTCVDTVTLDQLILNKIAPSTCVDNNGM